MSCSAWNVVIMEDCFGHGHCESSVQLLSDSMVPACREACTEFAQGDVWTECPALPDSCTVNIGDALMRWTDDKLKSNYHRGQVTPPPAAQLRLP